jgi:triacylglycerol lipase
LAAVLLLALLPAACGGSSDSASGAAAGDDDQAPTADDDAGQGADDDNDNGGGDWQNPGTRFPIVFMHGFGDSGDSEYFQLIAQSLRSRGFVVYLPTVSPVNSMETRAAQWAEQIDELVGPDAKVNMIAHSQGGLDARYMISTLGWGGRVGALATLSTPHYGSAWCDLAGLVPDFLTPIIDWVMNLFGMDWDGIVELSTDYVRNEFNPANPDDPRVAYYSLQADAAENCTWQLEIPHFLLGLMEGPNDAVVGVASGKWGQELGVVWADHWALVAKPVNHVHFDWERMYSEIALFLRAQGF